MRRLLWILVMMSCTTVVEVPPSAGEDAAPSDTGGGDTAPARDVSTGQSHDVPVSVDAPAACVPSCSGRECGDDGCGGSCGECPSAVPFCTDAGQCDEDPAQLCQDRECGIEPKAWTDCGSCPSAAPYCHSSTNPACQGAGCATCSSSPCDVLVCTPGNECGPDGCGGRCGTCSAGSICVKSTTCDPQLNALCYTCRSTCPKGYAEGDMWCDGALFKKCLGGLATVVGGSCEKPTVCAYLTPCPAGKTCTCASQSGCKCLPPS